MLTRICDEMHSQQNIILLLISAKSLPMLRHVISSSVQETEFEEEFFKMLYAADYKNTLRSRWFIFMANSIKRGNKLFISLFLAVNPCSNYKTNSL